MPLAETITILIETRTIADNTSLTGEVCAGRKRPLLAASSRTRTVVDVGRFIGRKSSAGSPPIPLAQAGSRRRPKSEGRSRARFTRMYPAWHVVAVEASLTTTRNSLVTMDPIYIPFYPGIHAHNSVPLSSLYDAISTKGYLEVGRIFA